MATAAEQEECALRTMCEHIDHSEDVVQLPSEILEAIFRTLPTPVVLHRVGAVCKDWHTIVKDDELWRLRCGLSELPSGFISCFAYAQRQTMREQALNHLYGRAGLTQNWRKGLQQLSVLADARDDYAMALYGWALQFAVGVAQDIPRADQLLKQSQHSLARAICLLCEIGVDADMTAAFGVLNTECDTSDPHVQFLLGQCNQFGIGCEQNKTQAAQCYERAGNNVNALTDLAYLHFTGSGIERDVARAAMLYRHAAEQGYSYAQYDLAALYEDGNGVRKDLQQAKHWYTLAAQQGDRRAKTALRRTA